MRTISVVGIGAGDPEHVTVQAINTLNTVDVVFMVDKGDRQREAHRPAPGDLRAVHHPALATGW